MRKSSTRELVGSQLRKPLRYRINRLQAEKLVNFVVYGIYLWFKTDTVGINRASHGSINISNVIFFLRMTLFVESQLHEVCKTASVDGSCREMLRWIALVCKTKPTYVFFKS